MISKSAYFAAIAAFLLLFSNSALSAVGSEGNPILVQCNCSESNFPSRAVNAGLNGVSYVYVYNPNTKNIQAFLVENSQEPGYFMRFASQIPGDEEIKRSMRAVLDFAADLRGKQLSTEDIGMNLESAIDLLGNEYLQGNFTDQVINYYSNRNIRVVAEMALTNNQIAQMITGAAKGAFVTVTFPDGTSVDLEFEDTLIELAGDGVMVRFKIYRAVDPDGNRLPMNSQEMATYSGQLEGSLAQRLLNAARRYGIPVYSDSNYTGGETGTIGLLVVIECNGSVCEEREIEGEQEDP